MFDHLELIRSTRNAYIRHGATIDQLRAELRDALAANTAAPLIEIDTTHDELFAPAMDDGQLEALFATDNADPFDPWDSDSMDADAAHVAELVECGDLDGYTVYGIPFRAMGDE